jgi:hypothetical protein
MWKTKDTFKINDSGDIFLFKRNRLAKCGLNVYGYKQINLNGKIKLVHRLVAENFLKNPLNKSDVNHINGIKTDNRVANLEWATRSENTKHQWRTGLGRCAPAKLKLTEVLEIKKLYKTKKYSQHKLAKMFGVSQPHIGDIILGQRWKHTTT